VGSRLYLEARGTWVFGKDALAHVGFAPIALGGLGYASFDGHAGGTAALSTGSNGPVTMWLTNGPFFITLGGGGRYAFTPQIAAIAALRANFSFGGNGMIPTFGPEVAAAYGF
jgi:hypothetical protein